MNRKKLAVWVGGLLLVILTANTYPQQTQFTPAQLRAQESLKRSMPDLRIIWNSRLGVPLQVTKIRSERLTLTPEAVKSYFAENFGALYQIQDPDTEIEVGVIKTNPEGLSSLSLYQEYENVLVYGVSLRLSLDRERRLTSITGKWIPGITVDAQPKLNQNQVMQRLAMYFGGGPYPLPPDVRIKPTAINLVIFNPGIYWDSLTTNYLAYHIIIGSQVFFVDAESGQIIYTYSNIQYAKDRRTYNTDDCTNLPGSLIINEAGPVGGAIPDAETQNAHDFAGLTYDYYWNTHVRDSYDDSGSPIVSTVHSGVPDFNLLKLLCCLSGTLECCVFCSQINAAWIPSVNQVVYGDGGPIDDVRSLEPLCDALDVVAHEITHGVTQYSIFDAMGNPVGLDYTGQSGALNESYSDFFAAMVDRDDWLIGEDVAIGFLIGALRDMADPPIAGQPDHMDNFIAAGDVHYNCGIPNKVAYLISEGGVHPYSGISVTGIGRGVTERILYQTLTMHLGQTATFVAARAATLLSTEELYPGDFEKYVTVWDAFAACGICDPTRPETCLPRQAACLEYCKRDRDLCFKEGIGKKGCLTAFEACKRMCGELPPVGPEPPRLTVNLVVTPPGNPGVFNILIDGVIEAANVGNGGTTGPQILNPGVHSIGVTASTGTSLAHYTTVIGGDCGSDGSITLNPGHNKACTITITAKLEPTACLEGCRSGHDSCLVEGVVLPSTCVQILNECLANCRR